MNKTRLIASAATATFLCAFTACGGESSDGAGSADSKPVSVPATKTDADPSYKIAATAIVTNEDYSDGSKGTVTVSASTTTTKPESNDHWLSATVTLKNGGTVKCEEARSHIWSDFGVFEDVPIPCDKAVDLGDVQSVQVVAP